MHGYSIPENVFYENAILYIRPLKQCFNWHTPTV